jgi:hypothetical protein
MRNCIILGSGRSGTSMLASTLRPAGYYMGDELLPPTSSNPKGYFEDRTVNNLNEDLLTQLVPLRPKGPLGRLFPWRLSYGQLWLSALDLTSEVRATSDIMDRMQRIVCQEPFCFKDPRFCYTLDAWRPVLGKTVFLCIFREPGRTAASMITDSRQQIYLSNIRLSQRRAVRAWISTYQHVLEKHSRKGQWLFVHYDQLLDGSAIDRIESTVEAALDTRFVDARLKRSRDFDRLPRRASQIYRRLCELAGL